jgi:hypothetical protein
MLASTIGIKLANREFYPILEENSQDKKRLVLTTVHDNQRSIQIDLYRSSSQTMTDALYIGSLVMEKITAQPKGQPSIELVISSTTNGDITAHAVDLDGGPEGRQTLSVSLKSLDEVRQDYIISDLDLEDDKAVPKGLYEPPAGEMKQKKSKKKKIIIIALILILLLLAIWFLFFRNGGLLPCIQQFFQGQQTQAAVQQQVPDVSSPLPTLPAAASAVQTPPPSQTAAPAASVAQTPPPAQATAPPPAQPVVTPSAPPVEAPPTAQPAETQAVPAAQPVLIQAPVEPPPVVQAARTRPVPPVASYNVPSVIPREGVAYRVRYGDTLWDISEAFYRNPWLYPRIARFNNIRNPDRIISGTTIRVPPRN